MHRITTDVHRLESSRGSNGFVVVAGERTAVIDPGLGSGADRVGDELRDAVARGAIGTVTDIVLTHYDPDHAGAAARLQRTLGVSVRMSATDAAILRGETPPPTRVRRAMSLAMRAEYPDEVVEFSGANELFDGLEVLPTPGHTPGHVALRHEGVLFVGDAALVSKEGILRPFPRFLISDRRQAAESELVLAAMLDRNGIEWVCGGHSAPARVVR